MFLFIWVLLICCMTSYLSLIFCMFFTAVCSVDKHIKKNQILYLALILVLILSLFAGTRLIGWDYGVYMHHFDGVPSIENYSRTDLSMEIGYEFFLSICKTCFGSFHAFLVIFSALSISLAMLLCYRYSPYPLLSFYMFFAYSFFTQVMGQMRQPIAIVITLLLLIPLLLKRRKIVAALWILCAGICFHKSLFFLLLFLPIGKRILSKRHFIYLLGGAFIAYLILPYFVEGILKIVPANLYLHDAIEAYLSYKSVSITFTLGMVERLVMLAILGYCGHKYGVYRGNALFRLLVNMYFVGVCIYFMFISVSAEFASRGTQALSYALFFALPMLLKYMRLKEKYMLVLVILAWGIYLSLGSFTGDGIEVYVPYKSILL